MHPRAHRCSRRLNNITRARQLRQLATHLREIKTRCIQTNEPQRSLRLRAQQRLPGTWLTVFGEDGYAVPGNTSGKLPRLVYRCVWENQGHPRVRTDREGGATTTSTSESNVKNQNDNPNESASQTDESRSSVATISSQNSESGDGDEYLSSISANWDAEDYDSSDSGVGRTHYVL
jgi:hypothetical protein